MRRRAGFCAARHRAPNRSRPALSDEVVHLLLLEALRLAEPEAQRVFRAVYRRVGVHSAGRVFLLRLRGSAVSSVLSHRNALMSGARTSTPCSLRVAHDLRGRVKAHRLRIQQRGGEDVGIMAFEPGRRVDQNRETRGVAFGKAVFAEAFDLREARFGEVARHTRSPSCRDEFRFQRSDRADALERRHRAAQFVRLRRRKAGADDGDLHRLLLEQRHAERALEHLLQRFGWDR